MQVLRGADVEGFREEARTWLEENAPDEPRPATDGPEVREYDVAWQRRQFEGGWAGIDWEPEHGGRGLSLRQQVIWYEELVRAGAPRDSIFDVAFGHAGPTLIMRGSEEQKRFHLPRILDGRSPWCQGFSEPDAGSDLAGACAPAGWSTATRSSSPGRRPGPRSRSTATTGSCWYAPIPRRPGTAG